jgi:hypothetical protein
MPGSIVDYAVSFPLRTVNFAGMESPTDEAETEAFRASAGLNALWIQDKAPYTESIVSSFRNIEQSRS